MDDFRRYIELHINGIFAVEPLWYNLTSKDFAFLQTIWQPGADGGSYTPGALVHPQSVPVPGGMMGRTM